MDWLQTIEMTQNDYRWPGGERVEETNPIIGKHPSRAKVNTLIPCGILLHMSKRHRTDPPRGRAC